MTVLAFDTATSSCAITVWRKAEVLAENKAMLERGHAEVLVPMIEAALADAQLDYQDLDLLAVTIGPGAFTGIRIGLATARSLALASNLPLIGITNFDALAAAIPLSERQVSGNQARNILVVLETKRADFYACLYDANLVMLSTPQAVDEAGLLALAGEGPLVLAGDVAERVRPLLQSGDAEIVLASSGPHVEPAIAAELAWAKFRSGDELATPQPLYLKPPDVNMSGVKLPTRKFKV